MTAIFPSNEAWPIEPEIVEASSVPRKRKRRQRSAGEECFTCRSRRAKCDGKRPYCTQCIEIGRECSGYKTTLTWGVGVASRGKLRGLSCPVPNKNTSGSDAQPGETLETPLDRARTSPEAAIKQEGPVSDSAFPTTSEVSQPATASSSLPVSQAAETWPQEQFLAARPAINEKAQSFEDRRTRDSSPAYKIQRGSEDAISQYGVVQLPQSGLPVASYADEGFNHPVAYSNPPISMPYYEHAPSSTSAAFFVQSPTTSSINTFSDGVIQPNSTLQATTGDLGYYHDYQVINADGPPPNYTTVLNTPTDLLVNSNHSLLLSGGEFDTSSVASDISNPDIYQTQISFLDFRFNNPFFHIPPRLQSWMTYYDRYVCPYLVAFDGMENPYRKHVLQHAMDNECLRNAIAALSINNLRMRRKELRRSGLANEITDAFQITSGDQDEPSAEELYYKQISIKQLNSQLTNSQAAQDDSVLATLLVLCLFHVCDTGFSKFKTQLAGVQKLLACRDPTLQTDFIRWIMVFFTWFDVMTSAVNDREMQIRGDSMDMLDFSSNLGAMEQFSGCDGRLFKLIARLSRLNLLAQGRPVTGQPGIAAEHIATTYTSMLQHHTKTASTHSLHAPDYSHLDGNGWASSVTPTTINWETDPTTTFPSDDRLAFWTEWHDVRCRLQTFQIDLPNIPSASSPNAPTDPTGLEISQRDMIHINESFRCAALLYTERLGNPARSSAHPSFQRLVSQALFHINALGIDSCVNKFLCWPLFIIGTECVDEGHRGIIRRRCVEVTMESGFYNNVSSLEVLEKVWAESRRGETAGAVYAAEVARAGSFAQPFWWRKAMNRVDGEYIVV